VLYVLNIFDLIQTIFSTHLLLLISLIFGSVICADEIKKRNNSAVREIAIGTVCLIVCSFVSMLEYYYFIVNFTFAFKFGLLVFVFFISNAAIKRYLHLLNENISAAAYKKLAYTDSLSGLGSRTAFSEAVESLQENKEKHKSLAFLVFDIDNLKPVNDSLGHMKGDELIKTVSRCLDDVFSGMGQCFRIGGDEFAAVIADVPEAVINEKLKILERRILESSDETTGKIGLSIGFEFCKKDAIDTLSIYELFGRADAEMYKNKRAKERLARQ
jgi:diguanylate cyclase (GGDEF)-like protein